MENLQHKDKKGTLDGTLDMHATCPETKDDAVTKDDGKKNKVESARSKKKVVIEKSTPDGLPPGWTKEVKITKNGKKIRRDPYYTDPKTGYVFRSMKDVLRYIDTGDLGRLAFKRKVKEEMNVEVEEDDTHTPTATKKRKLEEEEASGLTVEEPRVKLCAPEKDELAEVVNPCNGENDAPIYNTKDQPNANIDSSSGDFSATTASELVPGELPMDNGINDDKYKSPAPIPAAEWPGDHQMGNEVGGDNSESRVSRTNSTRGETSEGKFPSVTRGRGRSTKKTDISTPRRASKRLAGVPLEGVLELKTKSRTWQVVAEQSHEMAGIIAEDTLSTDAVVEAKEHSNDNVGVPNQLAEKGEFERQGDENQEFTTAPLVAVETGTEERFDLVGSDVYVDQEPHVPLEELWQDPCIAFSIQTLAGISFNNSDGIKVSDGEPKYSATSDSAVPEHPSEVADILSKANDEATSPQSIPPAGAWSDPCIQFAIKTLTDTIPLNYDMIIQTLLPQQSTSSQSQPSYGEFCQTKFLSQPCGSSSRTPTFNQAGYVGPVMPLPSKTSQFCQTEFLSQPSGSSSSSPTFNQADYVEPAMPLPSNTSSPNPGQASHPRSDERTKKQAR